ALRARRTRRASGSSRRLVLAPQILKRHPPSSPSPFPGLIPGLSTGFFPVCVLDRLFDEPAGFFRRGFVDRRARLGERLLDGLARLQQVRAGLVPRLAVERPCPRRDVPLPVDQLPLPCCQRLALLGDPLFGCREGLRAGLEVASVTARRRVRVRSTAPASAAPSAGSVPLPISSSSTSESAPARVRMSRSTATCAEKVERLWAMDWRSPMSANQVVKTGSVECGPIGGMMPLCAIRQSNPTALMSTVLPPVLGPETSTVNSSEARARSNGTTTVSPPTSNGCRPFRIVSGPEPIAGAKPFTSMA